MPLYNGQAGMGEAFVLQGNAAADVFSNALSMQDKQRRLAELQRQKQMAEQQQNISDNLAKLSLPEHSINYDNELQTDYKDLMNKATQLKLKNIDPNTNQEWLAEKQGLFSRAQLSKDIDTDYADVMKQIQANPGGYEDADKALGYYNNKTPLKELIKRGYQKPQLTRAYALSDVIKDSNGKIAYAKTNDGNYDITKVDRAGIVDQAIGSLDLPSAKYIIKKSGGDPNAYTKGFPTQTKDGKRYWNTKPELVEDIAIQTLGTDETFPNYLKSKGYDVSSPDKALASATDFITKQNKAVGGLVKDYTDKVAGGATTDITKVFTAEANRRANEANSRARTNFKNQSEKNTYIDDLKSGVMSGNPTALKRLQAHLQGINAKVKDVNGVITISMPINEKDVYPKVTQELQNDGSYKPVTVWIDGNGKTIDGYQPKFKNVRIGKSADKKEQEIAIDNLLKDVGLMKDSQVPEEYDFDFGITE